MGILGTLCNLLLLYFIQLASHNKSRRYGGLRDGNPTCSYQSNNSIGCRTSILYAPDGYTIAKFKLTSDELDGLRLFFFTVD